MDGAAAFGKARSLIDALTGVVGGKVNADSVSLRGVGGAIQATMGLDLSQFMTSANDAGIALQAAHDALPAAGGSIVVPLGVNLRTLTPAAFTKPVKLIGANSRASRIYTTDPTLIMIQTSDTIVVENVGFIYSGTAAAQNGVCAIKSTGGFAPTFERAHFGLLDIGVELTAAWGLRAKFCTFWDSKSYGLKIANVASPDQGDHELIGLQFANSQFPATAVGIYWRSSGGMKIKGGKFLDHLYSILCEVPDGVNTKILEISGASLEGMRGSAIKIARPSGGTTGAFNSVLINGNQFGARGGWGATPKVISVGAGISDTVITGNTIEGGSDIANVGVYIEDNFVGGGLIGNNHFIDIGTAIRDPDQGSGIRLAPNSYKGTVKVRHTGAGTQGAKRGGVDPIVTDIAEWNANQVGTWYYAYKIHIPANACAEIEVSWAGIQNGGGGAARYRKFIAFNNGGAFQLVDLVVSTTAGTVTNWSEYAGVVGTSTGDDGIAIGFKPAASQPMQGELTIKVTGQTNKIRKLTKVDLMSASYEWAASGVAGEYYLRTAAGGDPKLQFPGVVLRNTATVGAPNFAQTTRGTPGSLATDRWGYGDNDGLGYSTIYVRLPDSSNPAAGITNLLMAWE